MSHGEKKIKPDSRILGPLVAGEPTWGGGGGLRTCGFGIRTKEPCG